MLIHKYQVHPHKLVAIKVFCLLIFFLLTMSMAKAQSSLTLTHTTKSKSKVIEKGDWVKMTFQREKPGKRLIINMGVRITKNANTGYFQGRVLEITDEALSILNVIDTVTVPFDHIIGLRRKPLVGRHVVRILHAGVIITPFFLAGLKEVPALLIGGTVQELAWTPMDDKIYYPMWKLQHAGGEWKMEVRKE